MMKSEVFEQRVNKPGLVVGLLIGLAIPFLILAALVGIYLWRRSATPK